MWEIGDGDVVMVQQGVLVTRGGGNGTDGDESGPAAFPRSDQLNLTAMFICVS